MTETTPFNDLAAFREQLDACLAANRQEPQLQCELATGEMARFEQRVRDFQRLAAHLNLTIIRPRLEVLASLFAHAALGKHDSGDRSSCVFGYCERFPATVTVEFITDRDDEAETILIRRHVNIFPSFQRYEPHDKLILPQNGLDERQVAKWVEDRLFEFLQTYLRLDRGAEDFEDESVTDPVCGMRLPRSQAAASATYRGHAYFFCKKECREQFEREPQKFVIFKTN